MGSKLFGVGINDSSYVTQKYEFYCNLNGKKYHKQVWVCPFYSRWRGMLERCYSKSLQAKRVSYQGCSVCEEWLSFSNFRLWMEKQEWEGKHLDKDLIGDGKLYSPDTCCFIDNIVNGFIINQQRKRGDYLLGVSVHKRHPNKYYSQCRNPITARTEFLGLFNDEFSAHIRWKSRKCEIAFILAGSQKDIRVAEALRKYYAPEQDFTNK